MSIPYIKLHPKDILPLLQIIDKNENDHELMKKEIYDYLLNSTPSGTLSFRTAIFAYAFHTLRVLKLIKGRGRNLRLNEIDGTILLTTFNNEGLEGYKKELAKIIMKIDSENANVLVAIDELNKDTFTSHEVEMKLINDYKILEPNKGGKLTKWLRLLKYVRFIDDINDEYKYNKYQKLALEGEFSQISLKEFFNNLNNSYEKLKIKRRGNPYIPIPEIEEAVCNNLIDKKFSTFDFRRYLTKLEDKKISNYTIYLSKPGARESNGLRIKGVYYYYVAIFGE